MDIQEDGTVVVGSSDGAAADKAIQMIQDLTKEIEIGEIYTGKVVRTTDFGAFVQLLPGKDGMVHISELANYRVPTVEDEVTVGDEVTVLVTDVDQTGRVRLSRRALLDDSDEDDPVAAALARQQRGRAEVEAAAVRDATAEASAAADAEVSAEGAATGMTGGAADDAMTLAAAVRDATVEASAAADAAASAAAAVGTTSEEAVSAAAETTGDATTDASDATATTLAEDSAAADAAASAAAAETTGAATDASDATATTGATTAGAGTTRIVEKIVMRR